MYPANEVYAATPTSHIDTRAASSVEILKVSQATNSAAKKIDKILSAGKPLDIKIKGTKKQATKIIKELKEKIKYVNKQGVVFQGNMHSDKNGYIIYSINENNATNYKYAVKFIKKLFQQVKDNLYGIRAYYDDLELYQGDQETMLLRWAYENIIINHIGGGFDFRDFYNPDPHIPQELNSLLISKVKVFGSSGYYGMQSEIDRVLFYDSHQLLPLSEITFERFKSIKNAKKYSEKIGKRWMKYVLNEPDMLLYNTKNFCDLSDAMKVYAIDRSAYFGSNRTYFMKYIDTEESSPSSLYGICYYKTDYYMEYAFAGGYRTSMKDLYEGNAIGKCAGFARAECNLWDSLGLTNTLAASDYLNHAWSIVKVKNSKGKTLFIPFDYGIGPAHHLDLDISCDFYQKYDTDDKKYKFYLQSMKGAPKKRTLFLSDFN